MSLGQSLSTINTNLSQIIKETPTLLIATWEPHNKPPTQNAVGNFVSRYNLSFLFVYIYFKKAHEN